MELDQEHASGSSERMLANATLGGGGESALRELHERQAPRLCPLVQRIVGGSEPDAEDVIQETWIGVCGGPDRFKWDSAFGIWVRGIRS